MIRQQFDLRTRPLDDEGDCLFTLNGFLEACRSGCFTDDDGIGCWSDGTNVFYATKLYPSMLLRKVPPQKPKQATHIVWYNK